MQAVFRDGDRHRDNGEGRWSATRARLFNDPPTNAGTRAAAELEHPVPPGVMGLPAAPTNTNYRHQYQHPSGATNANPRDVAQMPVAAPAKGYHDGADVSQLLKAAGQSGLLVGNEPATTNNNEGTETTRYDEPEEMEMESFLLQAGKMMKKKVTDLENTNKNLKEQMQQVLGFANEQSNLANYYSHVLKEKERWNRRQYLFGLIILLVVVAGTVAWVLCIEDTPMDSPSLPAYQAKATHEQYNRSESLHMNMTDFKMVDMEVRNDHNDADKLDFLMPIHVF